MLTVDELDEAVDIEVMDIGVMELVIFVELMVPLRQQVPNSD